MGAVAWCDVMQRGASRSDGFFVAHGKSGKYAGRTVVWTHAVARTCRTLCTAQNSREGDRLLSPEMKAEEEGGRWDKEALFPPLASELRRVHGML